MSTSAPPTAPPGPETLGAIAVALAWDWAAWVNRRVETSAFVEDTTVRRSVSIDFTLPSPADLAAPVVPNEQIVVPLQIIAKRPLMHVDVLDEQRASVSTLNTVQNGDVAGRGLIRFLNAVAMKAGHAPLSAATARDLKRLVIAPRDDAKAIRDALLAPGAELERVLAPGTPSERPETKLVEELTDGFLLLVQIAFEPGRNRVLKFAHDVDQPWDEAPPDVPFGRALRGLGALPRRLTFERLHIGRGLGHHVEIVAPEDTEILGARLRGTQRSTTASGDRPLSMDAQIASRSRAHAYVRLLAGDEGDDDPAALRKKRLLGRVDDAQLTVALLPRRAGVVTVATISACFTAIVMVVFASRLDDLDGQTSAAVLLLVRAIVAAFVSRPGEHPFATRALQGVRGLALVGGALAAVLSTMIGAGFMKPEPVAPPAQAELQLRCRVLARAMGPRDRRQYVPSRVRCTQPPRSVSPVTASGSRVEPLVVGVSWILAGLSVLVALAMLAGYLVGAWVRRAASR